MASPQEKQQAPTPSHTSTGASPSRPALLPAFEPSPASPSLPRPQKRKFDGSPCNGSREDSKLYPTPVPTSSTGLVPSSPPNLPSTRPGLNRTVSAVSERVPLGSVPSIDLPLDGEPVLMGRSSNSSHYQLSANRLISRVHVKAYYRETKEASRPNQVVLECVGWNGAKVHCRGQVYQLGKGDTFSSDRPQAEIILDVQDARVMIRWPYQDRKDSLSVFSDATWDEEDSPRCVSTTPNPDGVASSPPLLYAHLQSPISPSPRQRPELTASTTFLGLAAAGSPSRPPVQVYEDNASGDEEPPRSSPAGEATRVADESTDSLAQLRASQSSNLSDPEEFSDHNEENDPIIQSFGPFGENLLPRMASFHAVSPERSDRSNRQPLRASISPGQSQTLPETSRNIESSPLKNHVINQLAFSRLHSLPLSTILGNLPKDLKGTSSTSDEHTLTEEDLKKLLDAIPCIGDIQREGKDAAGKTLENEFYYVPEMDSDDMRKNAVEGGLGKTGLRAVRKQHKQYYWKRPRH